MFSGAGDKASLLEVGVVFSPTAVEVLEKWNRMRKSTFEGGKIPMIQMIAKVD